MPAKAKKYKLKTKGSIKGRFRATASGKIRRSPAAKRHGMRKRSAKMLRQTRTNRGHFVATVDEAMIRHHAPYL